MKNRLLAACLVCGTWMMACVHKPAVHAALPVAICAADTVVAVSFAHDIQPIFQQYCAISGCHTAGSKAGGLNLDAAVAYQGLTKAGSGYIDVANPSGSLLYSQMVSVGSPMPPSGNLDSCTTKLVLKWIRQQAPNN